ncbi:MarR family winged helix-turn-helix transcriptional regulator [Kitasatospora sp. KL5]|uniref:MarR family winged helix-turn-helix transcriptional regulator n=1 Tax=Kitasatospora sp. KL5 TaxID=3425125 RepID=UPI003D6FCD19
MTTPPTADTAAELADALTRAMKRIRRQTVQRLEPYGITPAQARALRTLAHAEGHTRNQGNGHDGACSREAESAGSPMRLSALADRLRIAPRSATAVVDALEEAGLAARTPDPADRRAVRVVLTDRGRGALERIGQIRHEVAQEYFGAVSRPDQEALLQALRAAEAAYEAASPPSRDAAR